MKILFLSSWFPYPPINGAKIRIYNLIRRLAAENEITLLSFARTFSIEEARSNAFWLEQYCCSVDVVKAKFFNPKGFSTLRSYLSVKPRSILETFSPEMENLVKRRVRSKAFDVVVASEVSAPTITSLIASRINSVPIVLDALEIGLIRDNYFQQKSLLRRFRQGITWFKLRRFTQKILNQTNACTVPSLQEKNNLREIVPDYKHIEVIPHSLDLEYYKGSFGFPKPYSIVFTGSFTYKANLDAAYYFLEEIYPRVRSVLPEVRMQILGRTDGVSLDSLTSDASVTFAGLLRDVRPHIAESWLSVVPLRVGAGTRLKIIESMALGTPVVSTSKGAEGLEVIHGENILIADDPDEFAQSVVSIMLTPDLRARLSVEGRRLVIEKYSAETMGKKFLSLLDRVATNVS